MLMLDRFNSAVAERELAMTLLSRFLALVLVLPLVAACGSAAIAPATPVVQTVEVTRVVQVEVTREVVITPTPRPATATPAATSTPAPTRTPTPPPVGGKWQVSADTSSFDDSPRVVLSLDAEQPIEGFLESYLPTLILRCQERQTEAYLVTGMAAEVETGNFDGATVRIRLDDSAAETLNTSRSTDDKALFFENAPQLISRLEQAERLLFQFTPFNAAPAETSFDLRGLSEVLPELRAACGA
jgi:type VI secretion system protein VasI